jgi:hypothetical protein
VSDAAAPLQPWAPEGAEDEPWWQAFLADGGKVEIALPQVEAPARAFGDMLIRVTAAPADGRPIRADFRVSLVRPLNELGMTLHVPGWDDPDRWALTIDGTWPADWPRAWAGPLNAALNREWLDAAETERLAGRLDMLPFVPPGFEVSEGQGSLFPEDELSPLRRADAARIAAGPLVPLGDDARALLNMPDAVGLTMHLARACLFAASGAASGATRTSVERVGSLEKQPLKVFEPYGPMTVRDLLLIARELRRFADEGFRADNVVRTSVNEACRFMGYSGEPGGKTRALVADAFFRMRAATFQIAHEDADGAVSTLTYGLIDWASTTDGAEVKLNDVLVAQFRAGRLTYLTDAVFERLVQRDEAAARLWVFLESESLPAPGRHPRKYSVFSAPEGKPEVNKHVPPIADLLRISWKVRRKMAARVKRAAEILVEEDPRYKLSVEHATVDTMWNLLANRSAKPALGPDNDNALEGGDSQGREGGTPRDANRGLPGTQVGTPRDATPSQTPANGGKPRTLPSVLPSSLTVKGQFEGLQTDLEPLFGEQTAEFLDPKTSLHRTMVRAAVFVDDWMATRWPWASDEVRGELVMQALRLAIERWTAKGPKTPLPYVSRCVKQAVELGDLIGDDAVSAMKPPYESSGIFETMERHDG